MPCRALEVDFRRWLMVETLEKDFILDFMEADFLGMDEEGSLEDLTKQLFIEDARRFKTDTKVLEDDRDIATARAPSRSSRHQRRTSAATVGRNGRISMSCPRWSSSRSYRR